MENEVGPGRQNLQRPALNSFNLTRTWRRNFWNGRAIYLFIYLFITHKTSQEPLKDCPVS
jgi:hypothetical protein